MFKHSLAILLASLSCAAALASDGDPTPRKFADNNDDAQIKQKMSERWKQFGADGSQNQVTREVKTGPGGNKGCNMTVGPSAPQQSSAGAGKYGPKAKPSITVVTGSVINVCK